MRLLGVDLSGVKRVDHRSDDPLVGAARMPELLALAGSEGAVYAVGTGNAAVLDVGVVPSFGMTASPATDSFCHYGADYVTCLSGANGTLEVIARHNVGFHVYCCTYMPDGLVWVAGDQGQICEIDPMSLQTVVRKVGRINRPVYAMSVSQKGDRVFVVGQGGLALEIDRYGQQVADLLPNRPLKTAAAIRERLLNFANELLARKFIFEPNSLSAPVLEELAQFVGVPSYDACTLAPTLPILAIGTNESIVVLMDTRDYQIIQELDVGSGKPSIISGVHFLSDRELVVINGRGEITFFAT